MSWWVKTVVDALNKAIARSGVNFVSSRRHKKWQGKPGEIIANMPEEDRAKLQELKSDDISEEKMGRDSEVAAWIGSEVWEKDEDKLARMGKELKSKFDQKIIKK